MYDITNYASFEDLGDWVDVVKRVVEKDGSPKPYFGLVGNKGEFKKLFFLKKERILFLHFYMSIVDMEHRRIVRKERHSRFCKDYKMFRYYDYIYCDPQQSLS